MRKKSDIYEMFCILILEFLMSVNSQYERNMNKEVIVLLIHCL